MICVYCQQEATFQLKSGKPCCQPKATQCPELRRRNSEAVKQAHAAGKIPTSQLSPYQGWNKGKTSFKPRTVLDVELFSDCSRASVSTVRRRILADNLIAYHCSECGVAPTWNGLPLVLQLEHRNGINTDHRLENLCFLCPNCHSQTVTWGARNKKKRAILTDKEIRHAFDLCNGNVHQTVLKLGYSITSTAYEKIRRVCQPPEQL